MKPYDDSLVSMDRNVAAHMDEYEDVQELDEEDEQEAMEAEEDMREAAKQSAYFSLADGDGEGDPADTKGRIDGVLEVLVDFKNRREADRSRAEYMEQLARDLTAYYGYLRELTDLLLAMFSPNECVQFMEASDRSRPLVIRVNTLKTRRKDLIDALQKRGVTLEPLQWSKVAIKVSESPVPVGATPEYLAGHYMLQAASSLCPVMALDPHPGERVLDMSSAPGGKTSYIAQLMKNTGAVVANDLKRERHKATVANLHRLGVRCACVCVHDGRKMPKIMAGFDRVLLDAPCSGLGVISRDQSVKLQRTAKDILRNSHLQKELLLAAIDCTDPKSSSGAIIVYSTCSISTEENEQVIQYALGKRFVKLIDTGLPLGNPGYTRYRERRFHPSMSLARRFYPHTHNMDGFFVAKLKKFASGEISTGDEANDEDEERNGKDDHAAPDDQQVESVEDQRYGGDVNTSSGSGIHSQKKQQRGLSKEPKGGNGTAEIERHTKQKQPTHTESDAQVTSEADVYVYKKPTKRISIKRLREQAASAAHKEIEPHKPKKLRR